MTSAIADGLVTIDVENTTGFAVSDGEDMDEFIYGDDEVEESDAQDFPMQHQLLNFEEEEEEEGVDVPDHDPLQDDDDFGDEARASILMPYDVEEQSSDDEDEEQSSDDEDKEQSSDDEDKEQSSDDEDEEISILPLPSSSSKSFIEEPKMDKKSNGNELTYTAVQKSGEYEDATEDEEEAAENVITITSVTSLREIGPTVKGNRGTPKAAVFSDLDVYRCFICRMDFLHNDDLIIHRALKHPSVDSNFVMEKPFACGICGRPWNQPRKALACAVFGHDPSKINAAMFCHSCPMCPDDAFGFHSLQAVARHWKSSHPERQVPPFLSKLGRMDDFLPQIIVTEAEMMNVSDVMLKYDDDAERPLVIDNFDGRILIHGPNLRRSLKKTFSVFKCRLCEIKFSSQKDAQSHRCVHLTDSNGNREQAEIKLCWCCPHCNKNFHHFKLLMWHLRTSACNFGGFHPYKCILCDFRAGTYRQLVEHRSTTHRDVGVEFNAMTELPFVCGICGRPTLNKKDALICALYSHNSRNLRMNMFKHRCAHSSCDSLGFHSKFELRKHWQETHGETQMPRSLRTKDALTPKPFPEIRISLEQLLHIKVDEHTLNLVKELSPRTILSNDLKTKKCSLRMQYRRKPGTSKAGKHICDICGTAYTRIYNLRQHMILHAQKPTTLQQYKCVFCGITFCNSPILCAHRRRSKCTPLYAKYRGIRKNGESWQKLLKKVDTKMRMPSIADGVAKLESPVRDSEYKSSLLNDSGNDIEIGEEKAVIVKEELIEVSPECDSSDDDEKDDLRGSNIEESMFGRPPSGRCHQSCKIENVISETSIADTALSKEVDEISCLQKSLPKICQVTAGEPSIMHGDDQITSDSSDLYESHGSQPMRNPRSLKNFDPDIAEMPIIDLKSHLCNFCNKEYSNAFNLKRHITRSHETTVVHVCTVCKKSFKYSWNWKRHMKSHSTKSSNKCTKSEVLSKCDVGKAEFDGNLSEEYQIAHQEGTAKPTSTVVSSKPKLLKYFNRSPGQGSRKSPRISQPTANENKTTGNHLTININDKLALKKLFGNRILRIHLIKNEAETIATKEASNIVVENEPSS